MSEALSAFPFFLVSLQKHAWVFCASDSFGLLPGMISWFLETALGFLAFIITIFGVFFFFVFFLYDGIQIFRHMCVPVCAYLLFLESLNIHYHHIFITDIFCDKLHTLFGDSQATSGSSCSYTVVVEAVTKKSISFLLKQLIDTSSHNGISRGLVKPCPKAGKLHLGRSKWLPR